MGHNTQPPDWQWFTARDRALSGKHLNDIRPSRALIVSALSSSHPEHSRMGSLNCGVKMAMEKNARLRKALRRREMRLARRDSVPILHCMFTAFLKQNVAAYMR